jgi:hypothetical protein
MKKLLVVALSAMLVLAYASVSMAAITTTGEINVGLTLAPDASKGQFSDAKIVFDAAINDTVSANAAIKSGVTVLASDGTKTATDVAWDTYSISSKFDMGTLKLGYFGVNLNGKTDILAKVLPEIKPASLIQFAANVGEGMSAAISYDYQDEAQYIASFTYDVAPLYVQVGMENCAGVSGTGLNVGYAIGDALSVYLNYESDDTDAKDTIIGVLYTQDALSARLEMNSEKAGDNTPMGIKVAYTAANSLVYTLSYVKDGAATDATTQIKVTAKL